MSDVVYELREGPLKGLGSPRGLFRSIEGAKAEVAKVLETYHEFDDDPDSEDVNYDAEWEMRRQVVFSREVGEPIPMLIYGAEYQSSFKILTREVKP